jgi:hypothetical protein
VEIREDSNNLQAEETDQAKVKGLVSKGGMSKNAFGGKLRLDRLDLMESLSTNLSGVSVLYLSTIKDAVHNYLFFALGRNGTSADEFSAACLYFFRIRSFLPDTWEGSKMRRITEVDSEGKRVSKQVEFTDEQLKLMCFDVHYDYSGLGSAMAIDRFLKLLKEERKEILQQNEEQVRAYVEEIRAKELDQIGTGQQVPLRIGFKDDIEILTEPSEPVELARMLYYPSKLKRDKHLRIKKIQVTESEFQKLAKSGNLTEI